jgi:dsDNA-binding SOS-regulon protein
MENTIVDRIKNKARNLKTLSEELQVQMALGKAEARDVIDEERKIFSKYINEQRNEFAKAETATNVSRRIFLTCVEDLESALYEEVPEGTKAYDKYKDDILNMVYKLEEFLRDSYPEMNESMQDNLDAFKAKMDAFRVNLALHDKDNPEKVEKIRNEFTAKLEEIRTILNSKEHEHSKLDNFVEDISESFNYLKRAIAELSN